jgi:hypothetical protein
MNTKDQISTLDFIRVQVSIFAADAMELKAAALPATISTFKGNQIFYDGEVQMSDDEADFAGVYQVAQDYIIGYNRVKPT